MLRCNFCKKIAKKGDIKEIDLGMQELIKENDLNYFKCECGNEWIEVNEKEELFNLNLFDTQIKTFNDFNKLMNKLKDDLKCYNVVTLMEDSLSRINDWFLSGGIVEDDYVQNLLKNLKIVEKNY